MLLRLLARAALTSSSTGVNAVHPVVGLGLRLTPVSQVGLALDAGFCVSIGFLEELLVW